MSHKITILCAWILFAGILHAQQIPLHIEAYEQNSKTNMGTLKPLQNVYITAKDKSVGSMTDVTGKATLTFAQIDKATSLTVQAEATDMEVVNVRDLRDVALGRFAPLRIYMAPKGRVDIERANLIHMSIAALTKTHDAYIARLRKGGAEAQAAIDELQEKTSRIIQDREQAERVLNEQLEATKRRLPEFAEELARVNLDFASQMYRDAYACFKRGEIDSAIVILDEAKLDAAAAIAMAQMDSIDTQIALLDTALHRESQRMKAMVESYALKAAAHRNMGQFQAALQDQYAAIALQKRLTEPSRLAQLYHTAAELHASLQQPDSAADAETLALNALAADTLSPELHLLLSAAQLARYQLSAQDTAAAIVTLRKALDRPFKSSKQAPLPNLASVAMHKQWAQLSYARAQALETQGHLKEAMKIYESLVHAQLPRQQRKVLQAKLRAWKGSEARI